MKFLLIALAIATINTVSLGSFHWGNGHSHMGNGHSHMDSYMGNGHSHMGSYMGNGHSHMGNEHSHMGNGHSHMGNGHSHYAAPSVSYSTWAPASNWVSGYNWAPSSYSVGNCGSYGYAPVCGSNNVTYMNSCACRKASFQVKYKRACTTTSTKTYTLAGNGYYW